MSFGMNKSALLRAILDALNAELETVLREAKESVFAATDPDSKAENKYDTRALESSYLARGQARRVDELQAAVAEFAALEERVATPRISVAVGALVILDTPEGVALYFLGPAEGGTEVRCEGRPVLLITPASPLGRKLLGKSAGDCVTLQPGRPAWTIRSVE
jgi:transcription elongation GreA/GreB family factor